MTQQVSFFDTEQDVKSQFDADVIEFKNKGIKAKSIFSISEISKNVAYDFVRQYHYLGDAKFFCHKAYGLFYLPTQELVGCATYSDVQGIVALKGWFSLGNDTNDVYELSRLCLFPSLNGTNATSFLLGGSIKLLKKEGVCRAVVTLASSDRHVGSIYQVCNFKYFGMTDAKTDFYRADGAVNPRAKSKDAHGVWLPRARKHRYAYIFDSKLKCNYTEQPKPKTTDMTETQCCQGTGVVFDKRFGEMYTCPRCTGEIRLLTPIKEVG